MADISNEIVNFSQSDTLSDGDFFYIRTLNGEWYYVLPTGNLYGLELWPPTSGKNKVWLISFGNVDGQIVDNKIRVGHAYSDGFADTNNFGDGTGGTNTSYGSARLKEIQSSLSPPSTLRILEQRTSNTFSQFSNHPFDNPDNATSQPDGDMYKFTVNINSIDGFDILAASPICFHELSKLLCRNIVTNIIGEVFAKHITPNVHEVYSINKREFIPIVHNIVSFGCTKLVLLKKNSLGDNKPNEDFYITENHPILIGNTEFNAKDIKEGELITVPMQKVHTICTIDREPILVNNLAVLSLASDHFYNVVLKETKKGLLYELKI